MWAILWQRPEGWDVADTGFESEAEAKKSAKEHFEGTTSSWSVQLFAETLDERLERGKE